MEMMEERNCQLCGSTTRSQVLAGRLPPEINKSVLHSQYGDNEDHWRYQVNKCAKCGHFFASPVYDPKIIDQSYVQQEHDNEYGMDSHLLAKTNAGYVAEIARHLGAPREVMLDIGCDTGRFLEQAHSLKFNSYKGVEPSQKSVDKALPQPSTEYIQGTFKPSMFAPASFDLITMIHVVDHLNMPREFLHKTLPLLKPGGLLFAVVHNIDSLVAKVSGSQWHPFNLIHFDYYTESTLAELARVAGYKVLRTFRTKNYIDLEQIALRAPFLPGVVRRLLCTLIKNTPLRHVYLRIPLGNIGIIAQKE